jgi:hypothetical protein
MYTSDEAILKYEIEKKKRHAPFHRNYNSEVSLLDTAILAGRSGWRNVPHITLQKYMQHRIPTRGILGNTQTPGLSTDR